MSGAEALWGLPNATANRGGGGGDTEAKLEGDPAALHQI